MSTVYHFSSYVPIGTLVRAMENERSIFVRVDGEVVYGSITASEASQYYGGEIVFNSEEDIHEPILTVEQVMNFRVIFRQDSDPFAATDSRRGLLPQKPNVSSTKRSVFAKDFAMRVLKTLGMHHAKNTLVGSETVRGSVYVQTLSDHCHESLILSITQCQRR